MKTGVLGGTFDPVHLGHLIIAQEAQHRLGLPRVLFIPAGRPWLKADKPITPASHRLEMLRLAVAGHPGFEVSPLEIDRLGPTYTVDTVKQLATEDNEIYFILGRDSLAGLPRWHEPAELVKLCYLVAMPRSGGSAPTVRPGPALTDLEKAAPGVHEKVISLPGPLIEISSTEIRSRVSRGEPIRYWVPDAVERYIREKGLYRTSPLAPIGVKIRIKF